MKYYVGFYLITIIGIITFEVIIKRFNDRKKKQKIGYHDLETNSMLYFTKKELKDFLDKKDEKKAKTIRWETKGFSTPEATVNDFDFSTYLMYKLKELLYIEDQMNTHMVIWGVPVGPTLSMCIKSEFKGIKVSDEKDDLSSQYTLPSPFLNDAVAPFINDIQSGLFNRDIIAKYNVKSIINVIQPEKKTKSPYGPYYRIKFEYGFDLHAWELELLSVINKVVNTEQAEVAIEALPIYDKLRRMMDIMQAVPPARRKKNDESL